MDERGYDAEWKVYNSKNYGVPQNRERVYIVGCLRGESRRKVLPVPRENKITIRPVGNLIETKSYGGNQHRGRAYATDGISPTLNTCGGGGIEPKITEHFIDLSTKKVKLTENARCLKARYTAGITNLEGDNSGVMEVYPCLTPERVIKRQNGPRFKGNEEPMFTLTTQDRYGVAIRNATKQGFSIAKVGDGIDLGFPESKTRRGRVQGGITNTITTSGELGVLLSEKLIKIRKLTPRECWRLQGFTDEQFDKAKASGLSDTQLYKQAGNAVTVNVVYEIGKAIMRGSYDSQSKH